VARRLRELSRLVSYKVRQISLLAKGTHNPNNLDQLEKSIFQENRYSHTLKEAPFDNFCEKAMWEYYVLLEKIMLTNISELKIEIKDQILFQGIKNNLYSTSVKFNSES